MRDVVESVAGPLNRRNAIKLFGGAAAAGAVLSMVGQGVTEAAAPAAAAPVKVFTGAGDYTGLKGASPADPATMFGKTIVYSVVARGAGLGTGTNSNEDDCSFLYGSTTGDGTFICQVRAVGQTSGDGGNSSAGIMLRSSIASDAQNVTVLATDGNGVVFKWRTHDNNAEEAWPMSIAIGVSAPIWVKLQKQGTTATVWYSQNGTSWYNPTSTSIILPSSYLVGLCATTFDPKHMAVDAFANVSGFTPTTFASIMPPPAAPTTSTSTSS